MLDARAKTRGRRGNRPSASRQRWLLQASSHLQLRVASHSQPNGASHSQPGTPPQPSKSLKRAQACVGPTSNAKLGPGTTVSVVHQNARNPKRIGARILHPLFHASRSSGDAASIAGCCAHSERSLAGQHGRQRGHLRSAWSEFVIFDPPSLTSVRTRRCPPARPALFMRQNDPKVCLLTVPTLS